MVFRSHFRDLKEWQASTNGNLPLNTSSDVAAREYDAIISQLCGWYEDESIGGIATCMDRMLKADPEFLLGKALELELKLMGAADCPQTNLDLSKKIQDLNQLVNKSKLTSTDLGLLHVDVVNNWAAGKLKTVTRTLELITTLYPDDVSALKMNQDTLFMLGGSMQMRNSLAGSLKRMSNDNPLKGYAHGMFAFALEESNMYNIAKKEALKALDLIPHDTWAIHNYSHCLEMEANHSQGLEWMKDKRCDWEPCQTLACHQFWHTALFHLNLSQFSEVGRLLDEEILTRLRPDSTCLDLHDASSMLYRLELIDFFQSYDTDEENSNEGKGAKMRRWLPVSKSCQGHQQDHLLGFNDAHYLMAYLGTNDFDSAKLLIDSIDDSVTMPVANQVVRPLLEAMLQFKLKNYDKCVDLLEPIRFEIIHIGGSHAQRDIFEQILLVAALRSPKESHQKLAQRLVVERETMHAKKTELTRLLSQSK